MTLDLDGVPKGIRTPVPTVKGWCPRPLDDGDLYGWVKKAGGGKRDRTADLLHAMQALSQLSYTPGQDKSAIILMGSFIVKQLGEITVFSGNFVFFSNFADAV